MNWSKLQEHGWPKERPIKVLSIDGGGIRGIFPAKYLAYVEKELGSKIQDHFDLIVGTSTGGIIALGLSLGIPAEQISQMYIEERKAIFAKKWALPWWDTKYGQDELRKLLQRIFGDHPLSDAQTMLCIPSVEHSQARPKVYKTPHSRQLHMDKDRYMWEVALATSAAPLYFPSACLGDGECKLDGGLWANNPALVGIVEALQNGCSSENILLLSLGTGTNVYKVKNSVTTGGLLKWNKKIVELILCLQSEAALNTAKCLLRNNLRRISFICNKSMDLDAVDQGSIDLLLNEARMAFERSFRNNERIEEMFFK